MSIIWSIFIREIDSSATNNAKLIFFVRFLFLLSYFRAIDIIDKLKKGNRNENYIKSLIRTFLITLK